MSATTDNLRLPYIQANQAQKHVTHNEAIRSLDALVQLSVISRTQTSPPSTPVAGARYIVPAGATWGGNAGDVAAFQDGAWAYYRPETGWTAYVNDEAAMTVYQDPTQGWTSLSWGGSQSVNSLGINATANSTNRLTVASAAALFTHGGDDARLVVNKSSAPDTASVLFQTNFQGHAELGLTGSDDLAFKVSADGTTWRDALIIDRTSGAVSMPFTSSSSSNSALPAPQCRLVLNQNAELVLQPANGAAVPLGTTARSLNTSALPQLTSSGLMPSTTYQIYAHWTGSAVALEASQTPTAEHPTTGLPVKTGDNDRLLVGLARTTSTGVFADTATQRLVVSWWNRQQKSLLAYLPSTFQTSLNSFVEVSQAIRLNYILPGDEPAHIGASIAVNAYSAGGNAICRLCSGNLNTVLEEKFATSSTANASNLISMSVPVSSAAGQLNTILLGARASSGTVEVYSPNSTESHLYGFFRG